MIRVAFRFQDYESETYVDGDSVIIGRGGVEGVQVELPFDAEISRQHALVNLHEGELWIEDLESSTGTWLGDARLEAVHQVGVDDVFCLGSTQVVIHVAPEAGNTAHDTLSELETWHGPAPDSLLRPPREVESPQVKIPDGSMALVKSGVDARRFCPFHPDLGGEGASDRIARLYGMLTTVAASPLTRRLCEELLVEVLELIPNAERGAFLLYESATGKLALQAAIPNDDPPISRTLVKRAAEGYGYIWNQSEAEMVPGSVRANRIASGVYMPLVWNETVLGVISVDNPVAEQVFNHDDLRFLLAFAQLTAATLSRNEA